MVQTPTRKDSPLALPPLVIRPYQAADWARICQIHDAARPIELAGSCDPRSFVPIEEDHEVADLKRSRKLVACLGDELVGFVGVDGDYLAWLYVDPDHFGKGIGRKLLQAGVELIPGKAWTIALAGNSRAVDLYKSEGFIEVHRYESDNAGYPCTCLRLERAG